MSSANRLRYAAVALALATFALPAFGFDIGFEGSGTASTETTNALWPEIRFVVEHEQAGFDFLWDIALTGDGSYGSFFDGAYGLDMSILIKQGGIRWKGGNFSFEVGKLAMFDEVASPYSLFISGAGNAALTAKIRYEDDRFFYDDRWIALNYDSSNTYEGSTTPWPDRSAVLKTYGAKWRELRFGFQDLTIYTNEAEIEAGGSNSRGAPLRRGVLPQSRARLPPSIRGHERGLALAEEFLAERQLHHGLLRGVDPR